MQKRPIRLITVHLKRAIDYTKKRPIRFAMDHAKRANSINHGPFKKGKGVYKKGQFDVPTTMQKGPIRSIMVHLKRAIDYTKKRPIRFAMDHAKRANSINHGPFKKGHGLYKKGQFDVPWTMQKGSIRLIMVHSKRAMDYTKKANSIRHGPCKKGQFD